MVDATIRLLIYNEALSDFLGERTLSSLTESRSPRRVLDSVWDGGAMDYCLERANWNFAMRTVEASYSPSIEPDFGFTYAYDKPTDWLRTAAVSCDENFYSPLMEFSDEAGYWYCNLDTIFVKFVSKGDDYGYDLSRWTQAFRKYVASYLAFKACKRITGDRVDKEDIERQMKKAFYAAKSHDAYGEAAAFPPTGSWVRARAGRSGRPTRTTNGYQW